MTTSATMMLVSNIHMCTHIHTCTHIHIHTHIYVYIYGKKPIQQHDDFCLYYASELSLGSYSPPLSLPNLTVLMRSSSIEEVGCEMHCSCCLRRALVSVCGALWCVYRTLLCVFRSLLCAYRALLSSCECIKSSCECIKGSFVCV